MCAVGHGGLYCVFGACLWAVLVEETVEQQRVVAEQIYDNYSVSGGSKYKRLLTWKQEYWKQLYPIVSDYLQSHAHYLSHRLLKRPRLDVDALPSVRSGDVERVTDLRTPALVVRLDIVTRNCTQMLQRAARLGCVLRPHVKTHKTLEGATLQTGNTNRRITCSTLAEAEFFANGGFDDILYACPITPDKLPQAASLANRRTFHVLVDNAAMLPHLAAHLPTSGCWSVFVMVDCGYGRDGVQGTDPAALALVKALDAGDAFTFAGVYTHGGHSYDARGSVAIRAVAEQEAAAVVQFSKLLRAHGVECPVVRLCFASLCLLRRPSVGCACMRMRMRMGAVAGWGVVTVSMRLSDACWYVRKDVHGCVGIP
eukprot:m.1301764 g.1301764  ORF g.1301764 m.1301764 type:complete len:369 (-) comp24806_c0_seq18:472-1578(-)